MKPPELFAALYQRFKLNLIRRAHNALYELGLTYKCAYYFAVLMCSLIGIVAYVNMSCTHFDSIFTTTTSIPKE